MLPVSKSNLLNQYIIILQEINIMLCILANERENRNEWAFWQKLKQGAKQPVKTLHRKQR
ncbi:MAG: hypothetical protein CL579_06365 [Alteromonadaceae bacterium]|nr:hypothetical protein [Alteromonadaceae bacterium]MBB19083.1 hypothetical protein [Rickettsiales bacterium]